MNKVLIPTLIIASMLTTPSYALLNKLEQTSDLSSLVSNGLAQSESNSALVNQITSQLPVSKTQATGGIGSLLSLAQNQLGDSDLIELQGLIPGIDQLTSLNSSGSTLSTITDLESVNKIFNQLGLDSSMVSQYASLIMQYLTSRGASSDLIGSLNSLWL